MTDITQPLLLLAADLVDDLERTRIATDNRLRALTDFGLDGTPEYRALAGIAADAATVEHAAVLALARLMRGHPLWPWVKQTKGLAEKSVARLLALIGDPYWNTLHDRPRTVSELWAFCGLHVVPVAHRSADAHSHGGDGDDSDTEGQENPLRAVAHTTSEELAPGVAPKRRKGQRANWSTKAKTRAYLLAESCLKQLRCPAGDHHDLCQCSPYRVVYDNRRAHTTTTRPDWTDGHRHNDAMRVMAKAILRDLWIAAQAVHAASLPADLTAEEAST